MNFLLKNNIDATKFQQYFKNAITNKPVIKAANVINDYVVLQGNDLSTFTTAYLADMVALTKDPKVASLLVAYLHIK